MSPVTMVGPTLLTTGVAPKIPKVQAVPNGEGGAGGGGGGGGVAGGQRGEVVNVHTNLTARVLPNVSAAPVVIVAVKRVLGARALEAVKVATSVATT
jgi:hypothetical protein